jgi:hypothetical protein
MILCVGSPRCIYLFNTFHCAIYVLYRYTKKYSLHLFHDASLSVTISVLLGIELVHQRWLGASGAIGRSCSICSGSPSRTKVPASVRAMSTISISHRSGTLSTSTSKRTTDGLWLAIKSISALLATVKVSAFTVELVHGNRGEMTGSVVLCLVLVDFVDGDGGVHDGGLDSLLLDDGLDILVNVVVDVFTCNVRVGGGCVLSLADGAGVLELGVLRGEPLLDVVVIAVLDVAVLDAAHVVRMLLREDFLVLDGLDGGVVVVLVDLAVNGGGDIFVVGAIDVLVGHGRVDGLGEVRGANGSGSCQIHTS